MKHFLDGKRYHKQIKRTDLQTGKYDLYHKALTFLKYF